MSESWAKAEGDWGHFSFRKVKEEDEPSIFLQLKETFMKDEPTCQLLGFTHDFGNEAERVFKYMLGYGWSLLVEHKETKELVGFLIVFKRTRTTDLDSFSGGSYAGQIFSQIMDTLNKQANLLDTYKVEEMGEIAAVSVKQKWRKSGVATELYRRSLSFLQAEGVKLVCGAFTCATSRTIGIRLGFQEASRLVYKEFMDEMGKPVFNPAQLRDEHFAVLMAKKLG